MRAGKPGLGLLQLLRRGASSVSEQRWLGVMIYLVQLCMSCVAAWIIARTLVNTLGRNPLFDRAVDGDLLALLIVLREHAHMLIGFVLLGIATVAAYSIVSWYLAGGIISVFVERPVTWRQRMERFGAGGAVLLLPYVRLALFCIVPYAVAGIAALIGLGRVFDDIYYLATLDELVWLVVINLLPAALLWWIATTATAYARIDLARHGGSSAKALLRAYVTIFRSPVPLAHSALYWAYFAGVSALYILLVASFGWTGALGAVALFLVRQLVSLSRFGGKLVLLAGQVELSRR